MTQAERSALEKRIAGALRSCIDAHGPITPERIGSAAKRAVGAIMRVLVVINLPELEPSRVVGGPNDAGGR
jgi:hypothetical protein